MRFGQRAAEHGEILTEHEDDPAVDGAVAGDHPVAGNGGVGHAEVGAAVLDEHVPFLEAAVVEKQLDAFARAELAFGMLRVDALLAAAPARGLALAFELFNDVVHERPLQCRWEIGAGLSHVATDAP